MKFLRHFRIAILLLLVFPIVNIQAQLVGQMPLAPQDVPQFVDPLPHFAGLRVDAKEGGLLTIKMVPHQQVAVSTGTPLNAGIVGANPSIGLGNYWVYQIFGEDGLGLPVPLSAPLWPAFTIEAYRGNPLYVNYVNGLDGQSYADVNLVLDQTLHWALGTYSTSPYGGDVPAVVHLHGGEVPSESDGGPDSWFTPGNDQTGPAWLEGVDNLYHYPNTQEAATLWFHDHALGATRLNVYAGLAGFYFLRGPEEEALMLPGWSGDDLVQEAAPPGTSGINPNPPYLPEIEIVIQDRMFDTDGGLYYPNLPPNPSVHPYWTPEFLGDIITVNGKTWPYLSVAPRKYRFRLLNGSNARFYELWLQDLVSGQPGPAIYQVGTDGGLLDMPVTIDPAAGGKLIMGPGERFDVIIDFTGTEGKTWTVRNSGRTPFPKGEPPHGSTIGRIMQFVVNGTMVSAADPSQPGIDKSVLPAATRTAPLVKLTDFAGGITAPVVHNKRMLTLVELMGPGGPLEMLVNNTKWDANGMSEPGLGVTETPMEGTTEVWKIINLTADAHPMHMHLVQYQLVSRQKFKVNQYMSAYNAAFPGGTFVGGYGPPNDYYYSLAYGYMGGNPDVTPYLQGPVKPANPNEQGWKDTFIMYPGEVTTVIVRFAPTDIAIGADQDELVFGFDPAEGPGYVWHCHIIDHEDNEMMRPLVLTSDPDLHASPASPGGNGQEPVAEKNLDDPNAFELEQNSPNPFRDHTEIVFRLASDSHVALTLYNNMGAEVGVLIDGSLSAGEHTVKLDASGLREGVYFYRLSLGTGSVSSVKKLVVMR